ncbi:ABC transporter permease [Candidatus Roizmanbacteria bacterium]|nr:ABC transporter permease [Candidatus Roizmanbacteria bacterium]
MRIKRIVAVVIRHLYIWPRSPERFMWTFGWPFFGLLIWGLTISFLQNNSSSNFSFITMIIGGIVFWEIIVQPQREISINFIDEMWNKNILNLFASPLTKAEYLTALVIIGIIKMFITLISLTIGSIVLYKFNIFTSFGLHIPILFVNLIIFGITLGLFVNSLILRFGISIQEIAWAIVAIVQPFACVLYPLSSLPVWVQRISVILPPTYVFEEMRRVLFSNKIEINNLMFALLLNLLYLVLTIWFFSAMFEKAREHGRLVKLN